MDLGHSYPVKKVVIYNRNDTVWSRGRLSNSIVTFHDADNTIMASYRIGDASQLDVIDIEESKFDRSSLICFKFCQSLPNYPLQTGMEMEDLSLRNGVNSVSVDGSWKHSSGNIGAYFSFNGADWKAYFGEDVAAGGMTKEVKLCRNGTEAWSGIIRVWPPTSTTKVYAGRRNVDWRVGQWTSSDFIIKPTDSCIPHVCTCLYNDGQLPSKESLPTHVTHSLPKFSLKDATGKFALGLSAQSDCSSNIISIQAQVASESNPAQHFQITRDGRIVSVLCPGKVLTLDSGLQCSIGSSLSVQVSL